MDKNYKYVLLTILTLSVFVLTIIELTGVSRNSMFRKFHGGGEGVCGGGGGGGAVLVELEVEVEI